VVAGIVLVAGVVLAVGLLASWEFLLLSDLARAPRVRLLPRWAWAVLCLAAIPLGGIAYLLAGRVWQRHPARPHRVS
jgi:hypothetical protein